MGASSGLNRVDLRAVHTVRKPGFEPRHAVSNLLRGGLRINIEFELYDDHGAAFVGFGRDRVDAADRVEC